MILSCFVFVVLKGRKRAYCWISRSKFIVVGLYIGLGSCRRRVKGSIGEVERYELLEVGLYVIVFIYCCNMKRLFKLLLLFMIEEEEADAIESVFNLKRLLTESKFWFKSGLN